MKRNAPKPHCNFLWFLYISLISTITSLALHMKSHDKGKEPVDRKYVCALEKQFPRVVDKILLMWGAKEFAEFLATLMLDNRGDRQGFPFEVIEELMFLQEIHDYRLGKRTTVTKEGYRIG